MNYIINKYGEVLDTINDNDKVKIIRGNTIEYLNETHIINKDEFFVKLYPNKNIFKKYFLIYLCGFIEYKTNILKHDNGKILTIDYISSDLNIKRRQVVNRINKLIDDNIIKKIKKGKYVCFVMNPYLIHIGKRVDKKSSNLF